MLSLRRYKYNQKIWQHYVEREWTESNAKMTKSGSERKATGHGDLPADAQDFVGDPLAGEGQPGDEDGDEGKVEPEDAPCA